MKKNVCMFFALVMICIFSYACASDQAEGTTQHNFSDMTIEEAATAIAAEPYIFSCKPLEVYVDPEMVWVDIGMVVYDKQSNVQDDILYCMGFAELLFSHTDANMFRICFWETDASGNRTGCPVTMRLSKETAATIDFDYFRANIFEEIEFLSLLDGCSISGEYKKALK